MIFGAALVLLGVSLSPVLGVGYRITGWAVDVKSFDGSELYETWTPDIFDAILHSGETWVHFDSHYCWVNKVSATGYCHFYFKVTDNTVGEHYQILGGKTKFFDKTQKYVAGETKWGKTTDKDSIEVKAGDGFAWVDAWINGWGYAYMTLYVQKTTEPSLTQALFEQKIKSNQKEKKHNPYITGDPKGSTLTMISEFQGWTSDFGDNTLVTAGLYVAATVLKGFEPQMDQKTLISSNEGTPSEVYKERVMINEGCGKEYVEGQTGELTTTQSITLEETVGWSQTFSFGFSVSYEASFDIGTVSNTVSVSSEFSYEKSEDFSKTKSNTEDYSYKWPTVCKPGNKCRTSILVTKKLYKIPVVFTFERNGERFTEKNDMIAHVQSWIDKVYTPEATGVSCKK